jgi:hypothetical protein
MFNKIKKVLRFIKITLISAVVVVGFLVISGGTMYFCYTQGQLDACNAMLRNDPNTQRFGLYCEQMVDGITVRSTVLKKSLFNITRDKVYFLIGD